MLRVYLVVMVSAKAYQSFLGGAPGPAGRFARQAALDIAGVNTSTADAIDTGGTTVVNNTSIKSVTDFDTLLLTTLSNGGSAVLSSPPTLAISTIRRIAIKLRAALWRRPSRRASSVWTYEMAGRIVV